MPERVLFVQWNLVGENDVIEAIRACGYEVDCHFERPKSVDYDVEYLKKISGLLLQKEYQYVFSLDFIPIISRICNLMKIPYISWAIDCPVFMLFSKTLSNPYNYVFLFDQDMVQKFADRNPGHIFYMPLGTNVDKWNQIHVSDNDRERFSTDISFIGSLYTEKSKYRTFDVESSLPPYLKVFCNGVVEAQLQVYGYNFLEDVITDKIAQEIREYVAWNPLPEDYIDVTKETVANDILAFRCTELERTRLLQAVATHYSLDLYTQSDPQFVPAAHRRGVVQYDTEMPKVFQCSKINLNLTSKSIKTGLPLRMFDIMGAGGFLITNYQSELPDYFDIDQDLVVYYDEKDLLQKIGYYLEHDEERLTIAQNGQEKVAQYFTWKQRVEDIFAIVKQLQ